LKENYDNGILHDYEFFNYICEDKAKYLTASEDGYVDPDNDFLIGESGGFLLNIDFVVVNTNLFNRAASHFDNHKVYTFADNSDDIEYKRFWAKETHRRRYGMTAKCKLYIKDIKKYLESNDEDKEKLLHPLRITGDHYNFLNYGRIYRSLTNKEKLLVSGKVKKPKKKYGFPSFIDGQYWNFKVDEFITNNGYNLCKSKARRKGFSYMRGSGASNTMNLNKDVTIALAAYDLKFLTNPGATTDMVKRNLDWYENHTYWRRNYISEDYNEIELGYKKQKEGNKKFGFRSKLLSVGCRNNESALVGKDAFEIDFEEAGKFPNLKQVWDVTTSTTEDGDSKVDSIRVYGTGGTKDANWVAFADMFYHPKSFEMMPFENVWDDNLRHTTCGFFYAQIWGYGTMVDENGNSMLITSYDHDKARKDEYSKNNTGSNVSIFIGQRANKPSEAFLNTHENIFASQELNKWIIQLKYDPETAFHKDGMVIETAKGIEFKSNDQLKKLGYDVHPFIVDVPIRKETDVTGCIRQWYEPYQVGDSIPDDTYFITSDSVGIDKDKKDLTLKHSMNSFKVWTYVDNNTPLKGRRIVASYCGRFNTLKEYDNLLRLVVLYYNAKILPEVNRGETLANFNSFKMMHRILKDPSGLIEKGKYIPSAGHGMIIGDSDRKIEGLRMLKEMIYEKVSVDEQGNYKLYLHYIFDLPFLLELQAHSLMGNFDRISDAILAVYQYKALEIRSRNKHQNESNTTNKLNLYERLLYGHN
jgi:hypothetical protein